MVSTRRRSSIGELHNDGVRYVLERFGGSVAGDRGQRSIVTLVNKYVQSVGENADFDVSRFPKKDDQVAYVFGSFRGGDIARDGFRRLGEIARVDLPLRGIEDALTELAGKVAPELRDDELETFAGTIAVARHSARLWAPSEQGGDNGLRYVKNVGGTPPDSNMPWWAWDAVGFIEGGIGGAIALSVLSLLGVIPD